MNNGNSQIIKETILNLRSLKISLFLNKNDISDIRSIVETCRMIDVSMLPLLYIWEHRCHQNIQDLDVEKHLKKSYKRFSQKPLTYTWEFYLFLKLDIPHQISSQIKEKILSAYESLLIQYEII